MLPAWLTESAAYEPQRDRDGFLRKNILRLSSTLVVFRAQSSVAAGPSWSERVLLAVSAPARVLGVFALLVCMSLAKNMAFVWVMLTAELVLLASKPARRIRSVLVPALIATAASVVINAPALLMGQTSAPVRMGAKVLATVVLVLGMAQSLGPEGLVFALRSLGFPVHITMAIDLALRDIALLGTSALQLSEALELRSVGKDRTKTSSAAGVMGVTFLHAQRMASAQAEAMELRGYGGSATFRKQKIVVNGPLVAYACVILMLVALFVYLEVSMP